MLQKLDDEYKKRSKLNFIVYLNNGGISSNTLELYNTILSSSALIEHSDVCVLYDNLCLYDFITKKLDIESPDYSNLNRYIA